MIRYGILGFGAHGDRRLMPGFARARLSRVTAVSRRSQERARATAAHYGIPLAFDSKEALCGSPEVDAVFVATPNAEHRGDVLLALRHGKPVLCEKPMALNAIEGEEMVRAAREAGLPLGVALVFRFEESARRLRARVAAGEIGTPVFARSEFSYWGRNHHRTWLLDSRISGGGPVADVGVHCMDALRFILDDEVARVTALGRADADSGSVEAAAVVNLAFARGTLATVLVSIRAPYRTPLELVGERRTLRADNALTVDAPVRIELVEAGRVVDAEEADNSDAYARQVDAFSAALEGGAAFPVPGEVGLEDQRLVDAAYAALGPVAGSSP
ncbi:MAG: Gfo/Idh/MocA family protein [Terriglobales bacterium]